MAHMVKWGLVSMAVAVALVPPRPADACGGFFCSTQPVNQTGEHLLFSVDHDTAGRSIVTAHIQVQYEGDAAEFAWILPLPSVPDIGTGSDAIFPVLRQMTEPQFQLNWLPDFGQCEGYDDLRFAGAEADFDDSGADADGDADADEPSPVNVLVQESVGPYDVVVIESANGSAQDLIDWLEENEYQVPDNSHAPIQSYVNIGHVFLALKLQKDKAVGDITPVVVRFREDGPCIPLILTAIAANPDMPVYAWVVGDTGMVSIDNFLEVQPNLAAIDWFNYGANYMAVATAAFNEAGGRGFIREYAGTTSVFQNAFYREGQWDLDRLRGLDDPVQFYNELLSQGFPQNTTMQGLLREHIPNDTELPDQQFYGCLECQDLSDLDFDPEAFVADLDALIVAPLRDVQQMVDEQSYVTRLFTTISPEEMTEDPLFRFNEDVPDVSNVHVAEAQRLCGLGRPYEEAPIRLELPDGTVIVLNPGDPGYPSQRGYTWEDEDGDGINDGDVNSNGVMDDSETAPDYMPSLRRALRHTDSGPGTVVLDNADEIDDSLGREFGHTASGGGLCSTTPGTNGSLPLATMLGLALAVASSRRR